MSKLKNIHKYTFLWGLIVLLLFASLTAFGFMYKRKNSEYKSLENEMVEATKKYVDANFLYPQDGDTLEVSYDELIVNEYLDSDLLNEKNCIGYVLVKKSNGVFDYKSYLSCDSYKTKNYKE